MTEQFKVGDAVTLRYEGEEWQGIITGVRPNGSGAEIMVSRAFGSVTPKAAFNLNSRHGESEVKRRVKLNGKLNGHDL